jgi:hypothetical protein
MSHTEASLPRGGPWQRIGPIVLSIAGPTLIVLGPMIVLHRFWLAPRITTQQVDLLSFWTPRWCYLSSALKAGRIPTWLPFQFAGVPFASDPQSGWLYVPPMFLFSVFSCTRAIGLMVTLNPVLAGLGIYLFFRGEGMGRPAATVGGLTMALTMTGSWMVLSMPFSGTLAWTALSLGGAAGYLHARSLLRTIGWLAFTGFALSQVAAAHLTDGLLIAALVVGTYVLVRLVSQVRARRRPAMAAAVLTLALAVVVPLLGAGIFLPRLALLPRTSIGRGYLELARLASQLSGHRVSLPFVTTGVSPWWGTSFARGPGGYVGALAILMIPSALASRRWKAPAIGFAVVGLFGWFVNLNWVIKNPAIRRFALRHGLGELWLRSPHRFTYLLIPVFALLAGFGYQAWLDRAAEAGPKRPALQALWLVPAVAVFLVWPLAAGSPAGPYVLLVLAATAVVPLLMLLARGTRWPVIVVPVVVGIELVTAGLVAQIPGNAGDSSRSDGRFGHSFMRLNPPETDRRAYVTAGPIGTAIIAARGDGGRYLAFDPVAAQDPRGFLRHQRPAFWPAYENGRSILFGIDEIQGYSPVQLDRYWQLVRRVSQGPVFYNSAFFHSVNESVLRLLAVEWLVIPKDLPPPVAGAAVAREGRYVLYRLSDRQPRASLVFAWQRVTPGTALESVADPAFDPGTTALVEVEPRIGGAAIGPASAAKGLISYTEISPEHVRIRVTTQRPGIVVIRNPFDRNWRASVDGRPSPLLLTDFLIQGVPVPGGTHTVDVTYRDSWIGRGLAVSAGGWAAMGLAGAWLAMRTRSRRGGNAPAG